MGRVPIVFNTFESMLLSHYFSVNILCKPINMLVLYTKYSMHLTGHFNVLYDILQHQFEN